MKKLILRTSVLAATLALALFAMALTPTHYASADATDGTIVVRAVDGAYVPASLTVTSGSTVTITMHNEDTFDNEHDIEITGVGKTDGTCFGPCDLSFTFTAPAPGTYTYFCIVHADMEGTLTVQ